VLAIVIGAGLGASGAAMQGYLRNPLADPGLFGIAPGAALGAVVALWFGYTVSPWLLPAFALIGAGAAMGLLALIAGRTGGIALFTLAGLMVASLAGALTALAISLAPNAFAMSEIVLWLNGALTDRGWREVWIAAPLVTLGIAVLWRAGPALDALTLGDAVARSLGVDPTRLLWLLIVGVALTVGASVAVAGIIGFVGLIVLLQIPLQAQIIALASLLLVAAYPFMKRITWWPQAWLGLTFNWGLLVGWATLADANWGVAIAVYLGCVAWTVGYDTIYAVQDKEDDALVGIRSSALRMGGKVKQGVAACYALAVALWALGFWLLRADPVAWLTLLPVAWHLGWQVVTLDEKDPGNPLHRFRANRWAGFLFAAACFVVGNAGA